jgi:hypothetical protein
MSLQTLYTICLNCDAGPVVRPVDTERQRPAGDPRARTLRCSGSCEWSRTWVTPQSWARRNCQGICGRFRFGVEMAERSEA